MRQSRCKSSGLLSGERQALRGREPARPRPPFELPAQASAFWDGGTVLDIDIEQNSAGEWLRAWRDLSGNLRDLNRYFFGQPYSPVHGFRQVIDSYGAPWLECNAEGTYNAEMRILERVLPAQSEVNLFYVYWQMQGVQNRVLDFGGPRSIYRNSAGMALTSSKADFNNLFFALPNSESFDYFAPHLYRLQYVPAEGGSDRLHRYRWWVDGTLQKEAARASRLSPGERFSVFGEGDHPHEQAIAVARYGFVLPVAGPVSNAEVNRVRRYAGPTYELGGPKGLPTLPETGAGNGGLGLWWLAGLGVAGAALYAATRSGGEAEQKEKPAGKGSSKREKNKSEKKGSQKMSVES